MAVGIAIVGEYRERRCVLLMPNEVGVVYVSEVGYGEEPNECDGNPHAEPTDGVWDACDEMGKGGEER